MKKVVFISGDSGGIGAATAGACSSLFDHIAITYRQQRDAALQLIQAAAVNTQQRQSRDDLWPGCN